MFGPCKLAPPTLHNRLLSALNVRREETSHVRWLFLHHFVQGFGMALFLTVANSVFLSHFPIRSLPLVYIVSGVVLLIVGRAYAWLEHAVPVRKLMPLIVVVLVGSVLLSRIGLSVLGGAGMGV